MRELIGLVAADWPVWLGVAALLVLAAALAVWLELTRRRTYVEILSHAEQGTVVMDTDGRGRVLIVARHVAPKAPTTTEPVRIDK